MSDAGEQLPRVMLDLETLGTEPGCVVLSIGAVRFDTGALGDTFYHSVDRQSCEDVGLDVDDETLEWWQERDEEVQDVLTGGAPLAEVLDAFTDWYGNADEIWANAPTFDCRILGDAYDAIDEDTPWHYAEERCHRTIDALPVDVDVEFRGDLHHALDDAMHQARVAARTLATIEDS